MSRTVRRRTHLFAALISLLGVAWIPVVSEVASASPPSLQACTATHIKVSAKWLGDVGGQKLEAFTLTNTGAAECGMYGYPGLTFFTATRLDTHVRVVHATSIYASVTPKLLAIGSHEKASFGLSYRGASSTSASSSKGCLVQSILIQIPLAPPSSGAFAFHDRFNACHAGDVVAETPVEGRALPQRATY
jgi:hypothetical protein